MKKILMVFLMVLVLSIIFTSLASAEEKGFKLRNGIWFGDSMDDVMAKETLRIQSVDQDNNRIRTEYGPVAGIDNVQIIYLFDSSKRLVEVHWSPYNYQSKDKADSAYSDLKNALIRKYGQFLEEQENEDVPIYSRILLIGLSNIKELERLGSYDSSISLYTGWSIDLENEKNMKIDLWQTTTKGKYARIELGLSYFQFTDEELEASLQQIKDNQEAIDDDL